MQRLRNLLARRPECSEDERPEPFLRIQPIRRIRPSWLMARLARIFGQKIVTTEDGATLTGNGVLATLIIPGRPPQVTKQGSRRAAGRWAALSLRDWAATAPAREVLEICTAGGPQREAAEAFGVSQATISRWSNAIDPMPPMARRLAAALCLD